MIDLLTRLKGETQKSKFRTKWRGEKRKRGPSNSVATKRTVDQDRSSESRKLRADSTGLVGRLKQRPDQGWPNGLRGVDTGLAGGLRGRCRHDQRSRAKVTLTGLVWSVALEMGDDKGAMPVLDG